MKVLLGRRYPLAPETRKDCCTAESRTWPLAPRRAKRSSTSEGRVPDRKPAAAPRCSSAEDKRPRPQRPVSQSPRAGPSPGPLEDRRGGVRSRRRRCCCRMPPNSGIRLTSGLGADARAACALQPHRVRPATSGMPSLELRTCDARCEPTPARVGTVSCGEVGHAKFRFACGRRVILRDATHEVSTCVWAPCHVASCGTRSFEHRTYDAWCLGIPLRSGARAQDMTAVRHS